jgi:hypothetical protein
MLYSVHFIRDGKHAFSNAFEADTREKAVATAAIALSGFQDHHNAPNGIANLVRCDTGALIGSVNKSFEFVAA